MPSSLLTKRPVEPAPEESELLKELARHQELAGSHKPSVAKLIAPDGTELELPPSMYEVLGQAVLQLAAGLAVVIVPVGMQLSTQRAADLLGVSRPHVVKLLDSDEIPHTKIGKHRRVLLNDVIAYRDRQAARTSVAARRTRQAI